MDDDELRLALSAIEPRGRELLRRYLIADQPDRDAMALRLLHEDTEHARWLADLIDTLTMRPTNDDAWCGCSGSSRRSRGRVRPMC
jgi:hypothetical protein